MPENASVSEKIRCQVNEVSLEHMPVMMQYGGLQIEPITKGHVQLNVVWAESGITSEINQFIQYLKGETSLLDISMEK